MSAGPIGIAARRLLRARAFSLAVLITLGIAIGATTTVFSAVEGVLLRPLPYAAPDRLVLVWEDLTRANNHRFSLSPPNFEDVRSQSAIFSDAAAQLGIGVTVKVADAPELARGAQVTGNYFGVLGASAAMGRTISPTDTMPGARNVAVLSDAFWRRRLGARSSALGTRIDVDGRLITVIGVMPASFSAPAFFKASHQQAELWTPLDLPKDWLGRGAAVLQVIGRLRTGVDVETARRGVRQLGTRLASEYPASNADVSFDIVPMHEMIVGSVKSVLTAMFAAVAVLLLVAAANVSNLFLTRAMSRSGEIAIRRALGASQAALVRDALSESLLLVMASCALGLLLAHWGHQLLVTVAPPTTTRLDQISIDARVAMATVIVTAALGLTLALVSIGRAGGSRMADVLRAGGRRATASRSATALRRSVVTAQIALSIVLTVGAGLMIRTLINLDRVDPGFHAGRLLTMRFGMLPTRYPTPEKQLEYLRLLQEHMGGVNGVTAVAFSSRLPLDPAFGMAAIDIAGRTAKAGQAPQVGTRIVSDNYFPALEIPVVDGRGFSVGDNAAAPQVVMINRSMARQYWPNERAVGKRLKFAGGDGPWIEVIGVAGDVSHDGLTATPIAEMYVPYAQNPVSGGALVVRTTVNPDLVVAAIRRAVLDANPDQPLIDMHSMDSAVAASIAGQRFAMLTLTFFSALAVVLAALGLYAVLAHEVGEQRHELAIRAALGARGRELRGLVVRRGVRLVGWGIVIGLPIALAVSRVLATVLYGVSSFDPVTLVGSTVTIAAVGALAVLIPVQRASRSDPAAVLRAN